MSDLEATARRMYDEANARLLYVTAAAWVRWDDADEDVRAMWRQHARTVS